MNNGPVQIASTNGIPLIGAERLIYKVNNVNTSFTEMMGLPDSQVDNTYWLPCITTSTLIHNCVLPTSQALLATVTITIGGVPMGDPIPLAAGASTRVSLGIRRECRTGEDRQHPEHCRSGAADLQGGWQVQRQLHRR